MSIETKIRDLAIRIATELNGHDSKVGDLASLSTTSKASIVAAINELQSAVQAAASSGGASINDGATTTSSVWSSQRVVDEISTRLTAIIGSAPQALNTLQELAVALQDNDSDIAAIMAALASRVRTDTAAQGLTATQKANALANIGAAAAADIGNADRNFVADFEGALS